MNMNRNPGSRRCYQRPRIIFLLVIGLLETLFAYPAIKDDPRAPVATDNDGDRYDNNSDTAHPKSSFSLRRRRRTTVAASSYRIVGGVDISAPRMIGGSDASNPYPYFILWGGCGATLIHNDIALSAAHCSRREDAQVGPFHRTDPSNSWTHVSQIRTHPQYNPESLDYDFAVLKLGGWFQSGTVKLNTRDETPQEGESLTILGFGGQSPTLKQGNLESISSSMCNEQWRLAGYSIDEIAVICTKSNEVVTPCTGDSGGPLLTSSNVQVGIISSGSDCDGRLPAIFSRVSAAQDWIQEQICDLSDFPPEECRGTFDKGYSKGETVRIDLHLDDYPRDIQWKITTTPIGDGETREVASGGDFEIPNSTESRFVYLPSGAYYDFIIEDVGGYGDGLGTDGKYKLVTVDSRGNDERILVSGGGNFLQSESTTFVIGNIVTAPTEAPSLRPVLQSPSISPTASATASPSSWPSKSSTNFPTTMPSVNPTSIPTRNPSETPTVELMQASTGSPTIEPSISPTRTFTLSPTTEPTSASTTSTPTIVPTKEPSISPTHTSTLSPTTEPTTEPTSTSTTSTPTSQPTPEPTPELTKNPTPAPTSITSVSNEDTFFFFLRSHPT
uniref:Peptidase S1 domain-containing protein n=1 Tax=Pseudo-nitzschia australis TaxID=44445 RepID=A0A7S4A916_9STRA|mmetsp:Transcript_2425/g.5114  ORF Transcript_2425/g.5114 Transcript_2425/m.5114 type:complete len:615 (+) Transcript_2425:341-2185(+)